MEKTQGSTAVSEFVFGHNFFLMTETRAALLDSKENSTNLPKRNDLQLCASFRISKYWAEKNNIDISRIKHELTVVSETQTCCLFFENDVFLFVPRYYGLHKWSRVESMEMIMSIGDEIPSENALFTAQLIEEGKRQHSATKACLAKFFERKSSGCVLRMPCGFGKTVCSLYLVSQRRRKTIYIVQAENLFHQTIDSIQRLMPNARIGLIQGPVKTWKFADCDIVVAMMQTLFAHRDVLKTNITWTFGLVIVDECHHVGAPTFCAVLQKFAPAWFLGLTATPSRMDGRSNWIEWMIGPIVDVFEQNELKRADIEIYWSPELPTSFPKCHLAFSTAKEMYMRPITQNLIQWDIARRNAQTAHMLEHVFRRIEWKGCGTAATPDLTRPQVVVFANRIFHLCLLSYSLQKQYVLLMIRTRLPGIQLAVAKTMAEFIFFHEGMETCIQSTFANDITSVPLYYRHYGKNKTILAQIAATQKSYLAYLKKLPEHPFVFPMRVLVTKKTKKNEVELDRTVLFATVKKLGEGIDLTTLDTVCLGSSLSASNLAQFEQVIGRLRKRAGETKGTFATKRIIDFVDETTYITKAQCRARKKFYESRGMLQHFC